MKDVDVTDVYLDADITLEFNFATRGLEKNLHGEGHTLDANGRSIYLESSNQGAVGTVSDLIIENGDEYGIFWSNVGVDVTYTNVTHNLV